MILDAAQVPVVVIVLDAVMLYWLPVPLAVSAVKTSSVFQSSPVTKDGRYRANKNP